MGKDKAMDAMAKQQQKWDKKKDKLDKKGESQRGTMRKNEKDLKRIHQEEVRLRQREEKYGKFWEVVERKLRRLRLMAAAAILLLYLAALWLLNRWAQGPKGSSQPGGNSSADVAEPGAAEAEVDLGPNGLLTALMLVGLTAVFLAGGESWRERLLRQEQQKAAADAIKDQKDRAQRDGEREKRVQERRLQQQKAAAERLQRRASEEASELQQAKEIARMLRLRREQREKEEAALAKAAGSPQVDTGESDAHGWTARQRQLLREAVGRYPETWSHAKRQRWEMIASEVEGQDARACEATHARLLAERAAQKEAAQSGAAATSVQDDFDWMEDTDCSYMGARDDDEDEDDESEEDEQEEGGRQRMAVELEPEHKGTEIRLEGIKTMQGCATVQVELLHLQLSCAECKATSQIHLSGADEDAADAKTWCEGCSGLMAVHLRPTLLHKGNASRLCYVDCNRCLVTDVLPSVLMSVCESCDGENVHKQECQRNRVADGTCFKCHGKYAFGFEAIRITAVTPCQMGSRGSGPQRSKEDDPMEEIAEELRYLRKKAKADPRQQLIQPGKALPQMGACGHFKKSFKWYRFACCGRAFPCPECHVESGCPAAALGAHASRMICGKCSIEQSYSPARPCEKCGFAMQAKFSKNWEGGGGTRSLVTMSSKDSKKFKGGMEQANSKAKTTSAKASRVGAKAKAKREHARKFGE